ncbi:MAG: beta/gamma crystallin-related protein [Pseudomonadota bacterium]
MDTTQETPMRLFPPFRAIPGRPSLIRAIPVRAAFAALTALTCAAMPAAADLRDDRRESRAEILAEDLFGVRVHNGGFANAERGRRGRGGALVLFEDPGFRGDRFPVNGQIANLRRLGFNDTASSLRVRRGAWLVCTDPDFRGRCRVFTDDQSAFSRRGLNDRITSVRPLSAREVRRFGERRLDNDDFGFANGASRRGFESGDRRTIGNLGGFGRAGLIVYKDPNGRGSALPVNGSIRYLRSSGFNDTISSIEVRAGRWEVCSDPDFRGRCRVIDRSIVYTRDIGLNDNISSIRRLDGRRRR